MTLPAQVTFATISGKLVRDLVGGDTPSQGQVTFTPDIPNGDVVVASSTPPVMVAIAPMPVSLAADGSFSITNIVASANTALNPNGWTYTVSFSLTNETRASFHIGPLVAGTTYDLASLVPVAATMGALDAAAFTAALAGKLDSTVASGTYARRGNAVFDVEDFGAVADGVTDCTTAIRAALAACISAGGGTIRFLNRGVYLVGGAQQTGTAFGYTYSGQFLFPSVVAAQPLMNINIIGPQIAPPVPGSYTQPPPVGGAIIRSTAISGSVFDAIPAYAGASAFTSVTVQFMDLIVRSNANPQCGGINGSALANLVLDRVIVDTNYSSGDTMAAATYGTVGIITPLTGNGAGVHLRRSVAAGYGVGLRSHEHTQIDMTIMFCAVGWQPRSASTHAQKVHHLLLQQNVIPIQSTVANGGGGTIDGSIEIDAAAWGVWNTTVSIDDPGNVLRGNLRISSMPPGVGQRGIQINGCHNLNMSSLYYGGDGWMNTSPRDTFIRELDIAGAVGTTDSTFHPWWPYGGSLTTVAGKLKALSSGLSFAYLRHYLRGSFNSRALYATIVTGTAPGFNIGFALGRRPVDGNELLVFLRPLGAVVTKHVGAAFTDIVTGAAVPASTTCNVALTLRHNPFLNTAVLTLYVNNVQNFTYTLTAQEILDLLDQPSPSNGNLDGYRDDGIVALNDTESYVTSFRILPLTD